MTETQRAKQIFTMATTHGPEQIHYFSEFDYFGETWVIHRGGFNNSWKVSHKQSGYGLPIVGQQTIKTAKANATAFLDSHGEIRVREEVKRITVHLAKTTT